MLDLAKLLKLTRPLAVLDLETTGFDEQRDRICQIAITIHYPTHDPIQWSTLVHPQCSIPKFVTDVHGITNEAVNDKPVFSAIAPALAPKMLNVDIMGFNVDFDIKFLRAEMKRAGVSWSWDGYVIDAYHIYRIKMPHNLSAAYKEFAGGDELVEAHDAGHDVTAVEIVLCGQLQRWTDLPRTVEGLSDFCFPKRKDAIDKSGKFVWVGEEPCIAFGKYAKNGPCPMKQVGSDYWHWIMSNDFPLDCKQIAQDALRGKYPTKG